MARLSIEQWLMAIAQTATIRTTCIKRAVGCVLVDKDNHILGVGYNGVAQGLPHCIEAGNECEGWFKETGQDKCEGIHAEQNAILQCSDLRSIHTAIITLSPCRSCIKLLLNTPCQRIIFDVEWPDSFSRSLWLKAGRQWIDINSIQDGSLS